MAICASEVKLLQEAAAGICRIDPVAKNETFRQRCMFFKLFCFYFLFLRWYL